MRIFVKSTLKEFWEEYPDSEENLRIWFHDISKAQYDIPNEVISDYPTADVVGNNRIVFNICGNKYRLIVLFRYKMKAVFVRFIGTHKEYDNIKDIKNL